MGFKEHGLCLINKNHPLYLGESWDLQIILKMDFPLQKWKEPYIRVIDRGFSFVFSKSDHVTLDEGEEDRNDEDKDSFNRYLFCAYKCIRH